MEEGRAARLGGKKVEEACGRAAARPLASFLDWFVRQSRWWEAELLPPKSSFCVSLATARPSPAHEGGASQRHEVNLAGSSGSHGGEEDLPGERRGDSYWNGVTCACLRNAVSHLVVSLTKEFESLGSLVHEDAVQVPRLHRTDLDGLLAPAHDLV